MTGTLNKVMLIGHTGDQVKMRWFEGGGCIGRFPLATNDSYVNKSTGERVNTTEWHTIVVRNKAAEICEKYLKKGDKVYIEGRLKTRKWQDDQGKDRYSTEIQCTDFTFLTPKNETQSTAVVGEKQAIENSKLSINNQQDVSSSAAETEEDDLPF